MNTYADKNQKRSESSEKQGIASVAHLPDNRQESVAQRQLQLLADNGPQVKQLKTLQAKANDAVLQQKPNNTGLPDNLKSGMENLSGMSLDHVKVHYNSPKPAAVQAHAYAQGSNIHLAKGQEKHLGHELGHVVQQAQGRVKPTTQVNGVSVNDNPALEREADQLGAEALKQ